MAENLRSQEEQICALKLSLIEKARYWSEELTGQESTSIAFDVPATINHGKKIRIVFYDGSWYLTEGKTDGRTIQHVTLILPNDGNPLCETSVYDDFTGPWGGIPPRKYATLDDLSKFNSLIMSKEQAEIPQARGEYI